jgi:nucleoside-diphosphate-sugar epimerase
MKILVTGGAGYIGSVVAEQLVEVTRTRSLSRETWLTGRL